MSTKVNEFKMENIKKVEEFAPILEAQTAQVARNTEAVVKTLSNTDILQRLEDFHIETKIHEFANETPIIQLVSTYFPSNVIAWVEKKGTDKYNIRTRNTLAKHDEKADNFTEQKKEANSYISELGEKYEKIVKPYCNVVLDSCRSYAQIYAVAKADELNRRKRAYENFKNKCK